MARVSDEMQKQIEELAVVIEKKYIDAGVLKKKAYDEAYGIITRAHVDMDPPKATKKRGPKPGKKRGPKPGKKAKEDGAEAARKKFTAGLKTGGAEATAT